MMNFCKPFFLSIVLWLVAVNAFADAVPHPSYLITFEFYDQHGEIKPDSIIFRESIPNSARYDTLNEGYTTADYWMKTTVTQDDSKKHWQLHTKRGFNPLRIIVFYGDHVYNSELIEPNNRQELYRFELDGTHLKNSSPVFYRPMRDYYSVLIITILLEIIPGLYLIRRWNKVKASVPKVLLVLLLANLISHPLFTFFYTHTNIAGLLLEILVWLFEASVFYLLLPISFRRSLNVSCLINFISLVLGWLILYWLE